jgi:hypothetical protein
MNNFKGRYLGIAEGEVYVRYDVLSDLYGMAFVPSFITIDSDIQILLRLVSQ